MYGTRSPCNTICSTTLIFTESCPATQACNVASTILRKMVARAALWNVTIQLARVDERI
jgi:hypothetical protein